VSVRTPGQLPELWDWIVMTARSWSDPLELFTTVVPLNPWVPPATGTFERWYVVPAEKSANWTVILSPRGSWPIDASAIVTSPSAPGSPWETG